MGYMVYNTEEEQHNFAVAASVLEWVVLLLSFIAVVQHLRKARACSNIAVFHIAHLGYCVSYVTAHAIAAQPSFSYMECNHGMNLNVRIYSTPFAIVPLTTLRLLHTDVYVDAHLDLLDGCLLFFLFALRPTLLQWR